MIQILKYLAIAKQNKSQRRLVKIGVALIICAIFYGLGYYMAPEKIKIKTEMKIEKVVEEKIRTRTVIKEKPNGEKITTIVYENDKKSKSARVVTRSKEITNKKPQWSVSAHSNQTISIDRRLLGSVFAGAQTNLKMNQVNVYIRYEF